MTVAVVLAVALGIEERLSLRVLLAFVLSFAIGYERALRGAPAGDRTYAMVGTAAAAVTAVAFKQSPQAVAGVLSGIGFIGAGLVFRDPTGALKGITSAATLLAVVAIGVVAGADHPVLAVVVAVIVLVDLELRHTPLLKRLDARRVAPRMQDDDPDPMG